MSAGAAWTWRHAIAESDLPPTRRHVLLTLSIYMNEAGQSCYPSIEDMVTASGLSKRSVITHLALACEGGWLRRKLHGYSGQKWKRLEYEALWPGREVDTIPRGEEREQPQEGGEPSAPRSEKAVHVGFEGGEGRAPDAVKDVHRGKDQSIHQSRITPEDSRESARATSEQTKETFDALAAAWTQGAIGGAGAIGDTIKALAAIAALDPDDHAMAVERAPRFLRSIKDAKRSYTMGIESYVHGRQFVHHPPPAKADPADVAPVALKPFTAPLWAIFWRALNKARQASGNDHFRRRLQDAIGWIDRGVVLPAATIPAGEESSALTAVKTDSPEFLAWRDYCWRVGVTLPKPEFVPVIFAPALWPPTLPLIGPSPYRLAMPRRVTIRSPEWWWRFWKKIEDGTPVVSMMGRHRADPLERARKSEGAEEVDYGPIPTPAEIAGMVEVRLIDPPGEQWRTWLYVRGGDIAMWPDASIWCPSEYPTMIFGQAKIEPVPDYEALGSGEAMDEDETDTDDATEAAA